MRLALGTRIGSPADVSPPRAGSATMSAGFRPAAQPPVPPSRPPPGWPAPGWPAVTNGLAPAPEPPAPVARDTPVPLSGAARRLRNQLDAGGLAACAVPDPLPAPDPAPARPAPSRPLRPGSAMVSGEPGPGGSPAAARAPRLCLP